jgi:hypothetical protein
MKLHQLGGRQPLSTGFSILLALQQSNLYSAAAKKENAFSHEIES